MAPSLQGAYGAAGEAAQGQDEIKSDRSVSVGGTRRMRSIPELYCHPIDSQPNPHTPQTLLPSIQVSQINEGLHTSLLAQNPDVDHSYSHKPQSHPEWARAQPSPASAPTPPRTRSLGLGPAPFLPPAAEVVPQSGLAEDSFSNMPAWPGLEPSCSPQHLQSSAFLKL